jgi:cell fate (sporulation/competence/biofilm development) regulator YlbF (YheA/YmcA/DUF963 family)
MPEDEKAHVTNEVSPKNETPTEQPVPETQPQQPEKPVMPTVPAETQADRNFRALTEKAKRLERERDEAIRIAQAQQPQQTKEQDFEFTKADDELVEAKDVKAILREFKSVKEQLKKHQQISTEMTEEAMIRAQYPDYEKVVTQENIEALREKDPDLFETLRSSTSFRAKAVSVYKQIKNNGLYTEDTFTAERELAQRNANKPKPLASMSPQQGDSPLSRANAFANGLTPELRVQLIKEMEEARKNR